MTRADGPRTGHAGGSAITRSSGEFVYTRYGNPTVAETERTIGAMEHTHGAFAALTASGMAAIDVALSAFQTSMPAGEDHGSSRANFMAERSIT